MSCVLRIKMEFLAQRVVDIYIYLSGAGFWLEVLNCRIGTRNISSLLKTSCLHNSISHFLHHPHLPVLLSRKLHRFQFYGYTTDCRRILKCHDSSLFKNSGWANNGYLHPLWLYRFLAWRMGWVFGDQLISVIHTDSRCIPGSSCGIWSV